MTARTTADLQQRITDIVKPGFGSQPVDVGRLLADMVDSFGVLSGDTAGTVVASGAVIVDANKDISGFRNVTMNGTLAVGGDNGQALDILELSELTTIAAAATTDTTILIPAGAIVLGVSARVTVAIPTATAFNYGIAGATARYATGIAVAAGTTYPGTDDGARFYAAATAIRFTPNGTPGAATGRVRTTIHYLAVTPPTS